MSELIDETPCVHAGGVALCVLASGSGGNASVLRTSTGSILIDIGIGPRTTGKRLAALSPAVAIADIRAVCLTHLDSDHFNTNWLPTLKKHAIAVYCVKSRVEDVERRAAAGGIAIDVRPFVADESFEPLAGVRLTPLAFSHDEAGSHGFVIEHGPTRIGFATDLGRVPDGLADRFCDLDLLAIESNYDRQMQVDSERPWFLKQRIMGGRGHLSNAEAYALVRELFDRCERRGRRLPRHVVLLHRSRDCNCPDLLRRVFSRDARIAARLTLADQFEPTPWLATDQPIAGEQMMLAWG